MKKSIFESLKFFCAAILCLCLSAFATPARAALPSGYTELEYIESTGTQYIDTGVTPNENYTYNITFIRTTPGWIMGNVSSAGNSFDFGISTSAIRFGTKYVADKDFSSKTTITVNKSWYNINGTQTNWSSTAGMVISSSFYLFWAQNSAAEKGGIIYSMSISDAVGSLVRNFVPAKNASGKIGMYDTVNNRFYTNAGTGEFIAGPTVSTIGQCDFDIANIYKVGTPTITNAGIYTTNSSESYIRTRNDVAFATANTWSFKWRFTYHPANSDQGIMSGDGGTNVQAIINSAGRPRFSFGNDTSWNVGIWNDTSLTFAYQDGVTYDNEIYFDGTRYGFKVNGTEIGGVDNTTKAANTYFAIGVERERTSAQYSRAEWDLTHTSLTLDGVEQLPWCGGSTIKIATTKYNETKFSPLNTALANAISVVDTVVTQTITQAASIADLQAQKQTRPNDIADDNEKCPAGKKCLLVTDTSGIPHWYEIVENAWDLPAGYTQLEYIESTGTQYIDTGISGFNTGNWEIYAKWLLPVATQTYTYANVFSVYSSENHNSYRILTQQTNSGAYYVSGNSKAGGGSVLLTNKAINQIHTATVRNGSVIFDGETIDTPKQGTTLPSDKNMGIFARGDASGKIIARIYSVNVKKDGVLIGDFVPVKNSSGVVGMYDTVSGQFFTNQGTGEFVAGPVAE